MWQSAPLEELSTSYCAERQQGDSQDLPPTVEVLMKKEKVMPLTLENRSQVLGVRRIVVRQEPLLASQLRSAIATLRAWEAR